MYYQNSHAVVLAYSITDKVPILIPTRANKCMDSGLGLLGTNVRVVIAAIVANL
jgi:hypothetical protein